VGTGWELHSAVGERTKGLSHFCPTTPVYVITPKMQGNSERGGPFHEAAKAGKEDMPIGKTEGERSNSVPKELLV